MELFSELYSCYYRTVAAILRRAAVEPITAREMTALAERYAFRGSALFLVPQLSGGAWELLRPEGKDAFSSRVGSVPELPPTLLQKSWLRAVLRDPRIRLFLDEAEAEAADRACGDVEPLFSMDDFIRFDQCMDGDPYESPEYQSFFRGILRAIHSGTGLGIRFHSSKNGDKAGFYLPLHLEYSEKDDKFRLHAVRFRGQRPISEDVLNLGRIFGMEERPELCAALLSGARLHRQTERDSVRFRIFSERNGVERCMLHFANYEKRTEYDAKEDLCVCEVWYDRRDETEVLIRLLSFGPVVEVLGPERFLQQVRERVLRQKKLFEKGVAL